MRTSSPPDLPGWLPAAVRGTATELWAKIPTEKDSAKARDVLERLITNSLMRGVWKELYKKKRDGNKGFMHPARLTNASQAEGYREIARKLRQKGGEKNEYEAKLFEIEARVIEVALPEDPVDPEWTEQDYAVRSFLTHAYRAALQETPQVLSDIRAKVRKFREVAERLRKLTEELHSIDPLTGSYVEKLKGVAADCEDDAKIMEPRPSNEPWIIARKRGDLRRKTYVAKLSYKTHQLFWKTLFGTIAKVTNVVFSGEHAASDDQRLGHRVKPITRSNVREMLRVNAQKIRPSFGPLIYPRIKARMKEIESALALRDGDDQHTKPKRPSAHRPE